MKNKDYIIKQANIACSSDDLATFLMCTKSKAWCFTRWQNF